MSATAPAWWPQTVAAAGRRRNVAGLLLSHAVPHLDGSRLRLVFARPDAAEAWTESGAQAALEAALQADGHDLDVTVG
ncbi:hypothetical protein [Streptomyces sp. enrichment culture]|uniref:hypothetical protein n=1 Tax=Streptomyces sp. enrichment culture TaxID=1795815 RepID=UPI003F5577DA